MNSEQPPEPNPQPMAETEKYLPVRPVDALMGKTGIDFWTSLDAKNESEEPLIYQARQGDLEALADKVGFEFECKHVLMHLASKELENGEVKELLRIVLVTPDGECYGTFSSGVRDSLATLFATRGYPPYSPAIRFKVSVKKTGKGFKMLRLDRVFALKEKANETFGKAGKKP